MMDILLVYYILWLFAVSYHVKTFKKGVYHGPAEAASLAILSCAAFWFIWIPLEIGTGIYKAIRK